MADHLPDDPRHWPNDPFRLLGVEPPTTETDVKRAYTRLIRRFKPEHHPEQFRRVREAYEQALETLKWHGFVLPRDFPAPAEPAERQEQAEVEHPRMAARPEDEAWALAVAGKPAEAYSRLFEMNRARPEGADLPLRLYWLLAVHAALDPDRTRHDWLAEALVRGRLRGPAVELYRRELDADPAAALAGPYSRLLEAEANAGGVLEVARRRLAAAGLAREWNAIDGDLHHLGRRAADFDEGHWLSHLVGVAGCLAFEHPEPGYQRCRDQLAGLRHLELRQGWAFDQIDEQEAMARSWQDAHHVPAAVREVVRVAWSVPGEAWRKALPGAAAWAKFDPVAAMRQFDLVAVLSECRAVLATFQRLLDESREPATPAYPPGLIRGLVREFVSRNGHFGYVSRRATLLPFLIDESIAPEELAQACFADPDPASRELASQIRGDTMLRLAWRTASAA